MKFTKESLSFLGIYAKCADTKQAQNDKFQIKASTVEKSVTFSQFSDSAIVITKLDTDVDVDFTGIYPIGQFLALIQSVPNDAMLDIKSDGIYFNNNKYEFEKFSLEASFADTEKFIELIALDGESIKVTDFSKTKSSLIGNDDMGFVSILNENFVSSISGDTITCSYKTGNEKDSAFFIPKLAVTLCNEAKLESATFYKRTLGDNDFYFVALGKTNIIFQHKDYNKDILGLFTEETKAMYDHEYRIRIKKDSLKDALNRIKVFSSKNIYSRIYCATTNNQFKVESKEQNSGYAVELIEADMDDHLKEQDHLFCISQAYLSTVISYLKGELIIIHADRYSSEGVAIKITDEIGDDFFILCFVPE